MKVGVIDPQRVLEESKTGKRALKELKDYRDRRQQSLLVDEEELRNLQESLKDDSGVSESAKRDKQAQFQTKMQDYQRRVQEFNRELTGKQKKLVDEYMKKIAGATKTIAEKTWFTFVVDKGSQSTIKIVTTALGLAWSWSLSWCWLAHSGFSCGSTTGPQTFRKPGRLR